MTEAGKKWLGSRTGEASSFDVAEAEFWIRAFCEEVEKRTCEAFFTSVPYPELAGVIMQSLKLELLGPPTTTNQGEQP